MATLEQSSPRSDAAFFPSAPLTSRWGRIRGTMHAARQPSDRLFSRVWERVCKALECNKHSDAHSNATVMDELDRQHFGELKRVRLWTLYWLSHPHSRFIDPIMYSGVFTEAFAIICLFCWVLMLVVAPETLDDNPLRARWGYNNVCVGFDLPPMRYFAAVGWVPIAGLHVEYARVVISRLMTLRTQERIKASQRLFICLCGSHILFAFGACFFILCFCIPPTESVQWHTRPFAVYMLGKYFSTVALVIESCLETDPRFAKHLPYRAIEYVVAFGLPSLSLPILAELTYANYDAHGPGTPPLFPPAITFCLDWSWFVLQLFSPFFMPRHAVLIDQTVVHAETLDKVRTMTKAWSKEADKSSLRRRHPWGRSLQERLFPGLHHGVVDRAKHPSTGRPLPPLQMAQDCAPEMPECEPIDRLADHFAEFGRKATEKDPSGASDLACGLTISVFRCRLEIDSRIGGLHPSVKDGLFEKPATYEGIVRINVTEHGGARCSLRINVPDTMKLLPEAEARCFSEQGFHQMDLLLAEGLSQFVTPSPSSFLQLFDVICGGFSSLPRLLRGPFSFIRTIWGVVRAMRDLDNSTGVLGKAYYTGLPFKMGLGAAKFGLEPMQREDLSADQLPGGRPNKSMTGIEHEVAAKYALSMIDSLNATAASAQEVQWEFVIQLARHHESHSLVEADSAWSQSASPYMPVGTLTLLPEPARVGGILGEAEPIYFSPWNTIAAHRPLGAMNRARLEVYRRHREARLAQPAGGKQADRVCPFLEQMSHCLEERAGSRRS